MPATDVDLDGQVSRTVQKVLELRARQAIKDANTAELMQRLSELGGKMAAEEDVVYAGKKLIIPADMTLSDADDFIHEKMREDERKVEFSRTFLYRPWDGARATLAAMKKAFGMVAQRGVPGFFGETPPQLITIPISATETEQIPWGGLGVVTLPGVTFYLGGTRHKEYGEVFVIQAAGPRKYRHHVEGIFKLIEEELKTNSLYRGKAIDGQGQFLDLDGVNPEHVVYSADVRTQLNANIWALIKYEHEATRLGIPLKRAVLLEGPFGTGKTLAAYLTAQVAVQHGWTFIMCRPGRDNFFDVMGLARLYQPAVVFLEDVDSLTSSDDVVAWLDVFDGIQAKGTKIVSCLTTNHVEKIHKGMIRPGRLDAIIHIGALDAAGLQKLVEVTVDPKLLSPDIEWGKVTASMDGFMPAFAREAIDRAVRYSLAAHGHVESLSTEDFVGAANGLRAHLDLMDAASEGQPKDSLSEAITGVIRSVVNETVIMDGDSEEYQAMIKED